MTSVDYSVIDPPFEVEPYQPRPCGQCGAADVLSCTCPPERGRACPVIRCEACGRFALDIYAPADNDVAGWQAVRETHAPDCAWLLSSAPDTDAG